MSKIPWWTSFEDFIYVFYFLFQLTIPAWIAHKAHIQVYDIKMILHQTLLQQTGDDVAILRILGYMDARQLDHKLWGVIPVDLQLPVALISLCTTYVIVLIQFTHIID
ncbi:hypothetical protein NE865_05342 [Phthorimaea operculella]|nr:hypothetical protein NE865_05342 [Phthorimaea operculella]